MDVDRLTSGGVAFNESVAGQRAIIRVATGSEAADTRRTTCGSNIELGYTSRGLSDS
jgi:hypothetical protein